MNKEEIYDEQIHPLMSQIIAICKKNGIAMVASFDIPTEAEPGLSCTTSFGDENNKMPIPMQVAVVALMQNTVFSDLNKVGSEQ